MLGNEPIIITYELITAINISLNHVERCIFVCQVLYFYCDLLIKFRITVEINLFYYRQVSFELFCV